MSSDKHDERARELREEHQKICEAEHLTIKYGLRSSTEAQALLDNRFDEKCAAALRQAAADERAFWMREHEKELGRVASERDALRADLATARIKALNDAADYITGYAAAVRRAGYLDTERALMSVHESIVEMAARAGGGGT